VRPQSDPSLDWMAEVSCPTDPVVRFTRHLATMLNSGIPFVEILAALSRQVDHHNLAVVSQALIQRLESGEKFSSALERFPRTFPPLYIAMVRVGENTGQLHQCLDKLADWMEKELETYRKIKTAVTYPVFILAVALILTLVLCLTVLPEFTKIFESLNCPLPAPTKILLFAVGLVGNPGAWIFLTALVFGLLLGFRAIWRTDDGKFRIYSVLHRIPIFSDFLRFGALGRFCHAAHLCLETGMDLVQTLRVAGMASLDPVVQRDLDQAVRSISSGLRLSEHMRLNPSLYHPTLIHLLTAGEEAADMAASLQQASRFFQTELEYRVGDFGKLIEPVLLFSVSIVVGGILLAVFLPLYSYLGQL
jgi:type IV pilus assembly protein PilC